MQLESKFYIVPKRKRKKKEVKILDDMLTFIDLFVYLSWDWFLDLSQFLYNQIVIQYTFEQLSDVYKVLIGLCSI